MKTLLMALLFGGLNLAHAQQPMAPPNGDVAPGSEDGGGKAKGEKPRRKRPLPAIPAKRPPVKPPVPEPTAPDEPTK